MGAESMTPDAGFQTTDDLMTGDLTIDDLMSDVFLMSDAFLMIDAFQTTDASGILNLLHCQMAQFRLAIRL